MSQFNQLKRISDLKPAVELAGADLLIVSQNNAIRKTTVDLIAQKISSQVKDSSKIVFRIDSGYIQWQYVGDRLWNNLVSLAELQGPPGSFSNITTRFAGDGVRKVFAPVAGIITTEARKCTVAVGGVVQTAGISYTVSPVNNGILTFDEAPPNGVDVTIQPYQ